MIPQAKHLNFYDESIGTIHCIKLTKAKLHELVRTCPFPVLSERGASCYSAPMYEKDYKEMVRSGKIGRDLSMAGRSTD